MIRRIAQLLINTMKETIFLGIFLLCVANVLPNPVLLGPNSLVNGGAQCPEDYTQPFDSNWTSCYRIYLKDYQESQAKYMCESDGGFLASVPNAFVNSYLVSLASGLNLNAFRLGIHCHYGTCVNDDSTPSQYTNLLPGQQDVGCAFLSVEKKNSQKWYLWPCDFGDYFACEIPAVNVREFSCPPDYSYVDEECYKFVNYQPKKISANDAAKECQKDAGGNLATIDNSIANKFLSDNKPLFLQHTAFGLNCPDIKRDGDTSSCQWDDGTEFKYNGFKSEPNYNLYYPFAKDGSGCCDFAGGKWKDCYPCDDSSRFDSFICRVPVTKD